MCACPVGVRAAWAQHLSFQSYGESEGLTNGYLFCLYQDRTGYVFAGTEHGLFVYDGRRFLNFGPAQGLPEGSQATSMVSTEDGRLMVRYPSSIYVSTTPISAHIPPFALRFRMAQSLVGPVPAESVGRLLPWRGGALFAGRGTLFFVHADQPARPAEIDRADNALHLSDVPLQTATPLAADGSTVWASRVDGSVCRLGTGTIRCFGPSDGLPGLRWEYLLRLPDGRMLARSADRLAEIDPKTGTVTVSVLPNQGGQYANYPRNVLLALTPNGRLLTQGADGLMIRDHSGWKTLSAENGVPPVAILSLMFDRQGSLWLGALGRGTMRSIGYGVWENFDHRDGLSSDMLWQMVRQPGGPLWVASDGGLDALGGSTGSGNGPRHFGEAAFSVAMDTAGNLWRSLGSDAVACIRMPEGTKIVRFPLPQVSQIVHGTGTRLWYVTEKGVYAADIDREPCSPQAEPRPVPELSGAATAAAAAADGSLWVLRGRTLLHRHADGTVAQIALQWQQPDFQPLTLTVGGLDLLWIAGAGGGLTRLELKGDQVVSTALVQPPEVISNSIVSLLVDSRGWLWVGTDRGVSAFDGRRWVSANMARGLVWNDQDQGGLLEDTDGSMWFATSRGLSHLLSPACLFANEDPDPVITAVIVGDKPYREQAVPFTRESVLIQFGALNFKVDGLARFRYRLRGVDQRWVDTGSGFVRYAFIPPGRHRFELVAYDPLTRQQSAPVSIDLRMRIPWWLGWPLLLFYALAGLGMIYAVIRLRVRLLMAQKAALQREVALRTAEIARAQATDSLTGLLARSEIQARLVRTLADPGRSMRITIGLLDIDHFKRINDRFGHLVGDEVLTELGTRLKGAFGPGEYAGRYGGEEILLVLDAAPGPELDRVHALNEAACSVPFDVDGKIIAVTCSIGVAHELPGDNWKSLISRADRALYQAKADGRDRIVLSPGLADAG